MKHYKIRLVKADSWGDFGPAWFTIYNARGPEKALITSNTILTWQQLYEDSNGPSWYDKQRITAGEAEHIFRAGYNAWRNGKSTEATFKI